MNSLHVVAVRLCSQIQQFQKIPRSLMDSHLAAIAGKPVKQTPKSAAKAAVAPKSKAITPPSTEQKPAAKAPALSTSPSSNLIPKALEIIAAEVGCEIADLTDSASFADLGVDSLLSLNISGQFRESLDLDVQSTIFVDYPTISAMKGLLSEQDGGSSGEEPSQAEPEPVSNDRLPSPETRRTSATANSSDTSDSGSPAPSSVTSVSDSGSPPPKAKGSDAPAVDDALANTIKSTVAEELGVEASELDPKTDLASLGMDSLMSLNVVGSLKEATGQDLPNDFFATNATLGDVQSSMGVEQVSQVSSFTQGAIGCAERIRGDVHRQCPG